MPSNIERYQSDLRTLIDEGDDLMEGMLLESIPEKFEPILKERLGDKYEEYRKNIPPFRRKYQHWYSEARSVIKQLLPDRLNDFVRHYEKPKSRKEIVASNYVIEDYLNGLSVTQAGAKVVGPDAAIPAFEQQVNILKSLERRFKSTLFDIRQLVQADLFDSELDAAKELLKNGFLRAAGAVAGVVLEKHLGQVCANHSVPITKKHPGISDLNDLLKNSGVIDTARWRLIQHLADLRNLCDHNKTKEPKEDDVDDLIAGTEKIVKTLF
jgi:hypothetical protein